MIEEAPEEELLAEALDGDQRDAGEEEDGIGEGPGTQPHILGGIGQHERQGDQLDDQQRRGHAPEPPPAEVAAQRYPVAETAPLDGGGGPRDCEAYKPDQQE